MPDLRSTTRLAATLAVAIGATAAGLSAGAVAPASAAVSVADDVEVCQYNFDAFWRRLPVRITGTVTDGTDELAVGQTLAPGTKVHLEDPTVTATLPDWIETFGYESGYLPQGNGETPLQGWIAFEATNTLEGVTAPISFSTVGRSDIVVGAGGVVDEEASSFPIDPADLPDQTWTATGGPVVVRQALGTKMAPIPAGRTGGDIEVNGTLYVQATLGEGANELKLALDCTTGEQLQEGANHTDLFPSPLGGPAPFRAPNHAGTVTSGGGSTPLPEAVDASVVTTSIPRAAAGTAAAVSGATLELRLTAAQVTAWLGNSGPNTVTGTLGLLADRATVGAQSVPVSATVPTVASGGTTVSIPVPTTQWTPTGAKGADVRTADTITLVAGTGPTARTLTLNRDTAFAAPAADRAYPFAQILGPDPRTRFDEPTPGGGDGGVGTTNPPPIDTGGGTFAPPPVAVPPAAVPPVTTPAPAATKPPPAAAKVASIRVRTTSVKARKGRLSLILANLDAGVVTKGRLSLVSTAKYRVGRAKTAKRITLLKATSFSLPKGKRGTVTVKLTKDGAALLKARRSVAATLTVTPAKASTQKTVTGKVTVRR